MTARRLSRADVDREHTLEWLMARDDAETRPCPTCRAPAAVTCRNVHTGRPVTGPPAHLARLCPIPAQRSPSDPPAVRPPAAPRPPGAEPAVAPRPAGSAPTRTAA